MGVISGCDHNNFIFEKGELLRTDGSAVHQSLDALLMWPAVRNLERTYASVSYASQCATSKFIHWLWNLLSVFNPVKNSWNGSVWHGELELKKIKIIQKGFFVVCTIAFLRGRGKQVKSGEDEGAGAGAVAGLKALLFPPGVEYRSSWLPTQATDKTLHFPWLPPPPLVRRYDVVFSELENNPEITRSNYTKLCSIKTTGARFTFFFLTWQALCDSEKILMWHHFEIQNSNQDDHPMSAYAPWAGLLVHLET